MIQDKIITILQDHCTSGIVPTIANKGMRFFVTNLEKPSLPQARIAFSSNSLRTNVTDEAVREKIDTDQVWRVRIEGYLQFPNSHREVYEKQFAWKRAKIQKSEESIGRLIDALLIEDAKNHMPDVEYMTSRTRTKFEEPIYYFTDQGQLMTKIRFSSWMTRYIPLQWGDDQESDIRRCADKIINHLHNRERLIVGESRYWGYSDEGDCYGRYSENRPIAARRDLVWRINNNRPFREHRDMARFIIGHEDQDKAVKIEEPIRYGNHTSYPEEYEETRLVITRPPRTTPQTIEELLDLVDIEESRVS